MAYTLARVVMVATKLGVFEALASGASTAPAVAERCGTESAATEKLLFALAGSGYVRSDDGQYVLSPMARKWLFRDSPTSLADKLVFQFDEWEWLERADQYIRTREPIEIYDVMDDNKGELSAWHEVARRRVRCRGRAPASRTAGRRRGCGARSG